MGDWNKQAAPNNNRTSGQIQFTSGKQHYNQEVADELSGNRDALIQSTKKLNKKKK